MRFSVLVPVYNKQDFLNDCVQSVVAQSFSDWELILVDDGSTDQSPSICDRWCSEDHRIHVIHQENCGLIAARRAGIHAASGEYTVFLDADDWLDPDALFQIDQVIRKNQADAVLFGDIDYFPDGKTQILHTAFPDGSVYTGENKQVILEELIRSWKLNCLVQKCFLSTLVQADDTDYSLYRNPNTEDLLQSLFPMTHAERIVFLDRPLYCYRVDPVSSISFKIDPGAPERQFNRPVMDQLRHYMTIWGMDSEHYLKLFHTRQLNSFLAVFWQHYKQASTRKEQESVLSYDWDSLIRAEDLSYRGDLPFLRRIQLDAVIHRSRTVLNLIELLERVRKGA